MLDKNTYANAAVQVFAAARFRCRVATANVASSILIIAMSVCFYLGVKRGSILLQSIAFNASLVF